MFVFKAAVVGAGTMGGEIAHTIADAGVPVLLKDVEERFVRSGIDRARSLWQARVDAGKMDGEALERSLSLITGTTSYDSFGDVDFVIEAVPERIELKQVVFAELDEATPGHTVLASNTSSLSITEIGEGTSRPDKVVGFHFFYPVSTARAIEVTEGADTSPETAQVASNFAQAIRKAPIRCGDSPGFVVNRILNAGVSEWWRAQEENGIEPQEFDKLVAESSSSGFGPFLIADVLGIDTVVSVSVYLQRNFGERFHVHGPMRELVAKGDLGVKTGKGFYEHGS